MPRTSPVHYIAPSAISITPNANDSANDLAVYIARGAVIKVCCNAIPELAPQDGNYREWTITGRNRRLANSDVPYTIYARLSKSSTDAYLIFAPQSWRHTKYADKYPYVTAGGLSTLEDSPSADVINMMRDHWFIRLGDVSLPEEDLRSVNLDTGILGTDQYNEEWVLNPDDLPLRVVLSNSKTADVPFVLWGESILVEAHLVQGWSTNVDAERVKRWSIRRDSGNADTDAVWNQSESGRTMTDGAITLSHARSGGDDFGAAPSVAFVITAWGEPESDDSSSDGDGSTLVALAESSITILAETNEKYELALSTHIVSYSPVREQYSPSAGVDVRIRAIAQDGTVSSLTQEQFDAARLTVVYAPAAEGSSAETELEFSGVPATEAKATIPVSAFSAQKSLDVRLQNDAGVELASESIAFVRDGEDSKEREWIYRLNNANGYDSTEANRGKEFSDDDFVPTGWTDDPVGVSESGDTEYASWRDYNATQGRWGAFHAPVIWSHFGSDGDDGEDGVVYSLKPSLSQVKVARTDAGGYSPANVPLTCGYVKNVGGVFTTVADAPDIIDAKYYIYYRFRNRTTQQWSGYFRYGLESSYEVIATTGVDVAVYDAVEFILCTNTGNAIASDEYVTGLIDRLAVPIVADGKKGDNGDDAITVSANPSSVSFECDASGKSVDVNVKEVELAMYKGSSPVTFSATVASAVNCSAWIAEGKVLVSTGGAWKNGSDIVYTDKPYPYVEVGDNVYNADGQNVGSVSSKGSVYITLGTSSVRYAGMSDASYRSLSNDGSVVVTLTGSGTSRSITIPVIGNKRGADGADGRPGSSGVMLYPAGVWEAKTYEANGDSRPYVLYKPDGRYYYLNDDSASAADVPGTSDKWTLMAQVDVVYAKFGIMDYGQMASAVFCGDWMYSQYGKLYTSDSAYTVIDGSNYDTPFTFGDESAVPFAWFNPDYPQGGSPATFAPNWAVNLMTGQSFQGDANISGTVVAENFYVSTMFSGDGLTGDSIALISPEEFHQEHNYPTSGDADYEVCNSFVRGSVVDLSVRGDIASLFERRFGILLPDGWKPTTGTRQKVFVFPGSETVYLPSPSLYHGKLVEVYNHSGDAFDVRCIDSEADSPVEQIVEDGIVYRQVFVSASYAGQQDYSGLWIVRGKPVVGEHHAKYFYTIPAGKKASFLSMEVWTDAENDVKYYFWAMLELAAIM